MLLSRYWIRKEMNDKNRNAIEFIIIKIIYYSVKMNE